MEAIRLDKWLWAARLYKTRSLAKKAIEGGKIRVNNVKAKASRMIQCGDLIELSQGWSKKMVVVKILDDHRKSATYAVSLYEETQESLEKREKEKENRRFAHQMLVPPAKRPNKKQRRTILKMKKQSND